MVHKIREVGYVFAGVIDKSFKEKNDIWWSAFVVAPSILGTVQAFFEGSQLQGYQVMLLMFFTTLLTGLLWTTKPVGMKDTVVLVSAIVLYIILFTQSYRIVSDFSRVLFTLPGYLLIFTKAGAANVRRNVAICFFMAILFVSYVLENSSYYLFFSDMVIWFLLTFFVVTNTRDKAFLKPVFVVSSAAFVVLRWIAMWTLFRISLVVSVVSFFVMVSTASSISKIPVWIVYLVQSVICFFVYDSFVKNYKKISQSRPIFVALSNILNPARKWIRFTTNMFFIVIFAFPAYGIFYTDFYDVMDFVGTISIEKVYSAIYSEIPKNIVGGK